MLKPMTDHNLETNILFSAMAIFNVFSFHWQRRLSQHRTSGSGETQRVPHRSGDHRWAALHSPGILMKPNTPTFTDFSSVAGNRNSCFCTCRVCASQFVSALIVFVASLPHPPKHHLPTGPSTPQIDIRWISDWSFYPLCLSPRGVPSLELHGPSPPFKHHEVKI